MFDSSVSAFLRGLKRQISNFIRFPIVRIAHAHAKLLQLFNRPCARLLAQPRVRFQARMVNFHDLINDLFHALVQLLRTVGIGVQFADRQGIKLLTAL